MAFSFPQWKWASWAGIGHLLADDSFDFDLGSALLPSPKSLAQQIFEPAQVNHEAAIFI